MKVPRRPYTLLLLATLPFASTAQAQVQKCLPQSFTAYDVVSSSGASPNLVRIASDLPNQRQRIDYQSRDAQGTWANSLTEAGPAIDPGTGLTPTISSQITDFGLGPQLGVALQFVFGDGSCSTSKIQSTLDQRCLPVDVSAGTEQVGAVVLTRWTATVDNGDGSTTDWSARFSNTNVPVDITYRTRKAGVLVAIGYEYFAEYVSKVRLTDFDAESLCAY
jgi:hypothetical protein